MFNPSDMFARFAARIRIGMVPAAAAAICWAGCRQQASPPVEPPAPPPPAAPAPLPAPEPPREFSFTNRAEMVSEQVVQASLAGRENYIKADFNADGRTDLVVLENMTDGNIELAVYIQAPPEPPTPTPAGEAPSDTLAEEAVRKYFRAGSIQRPLDGKFTGLATRRTSKYTDLMILYDDGVAPEILHFRNDGTRFYEVR